MSSAVLYLTTGQPGCGKTYSRVRWLMSDFLPNSSGLYITNLPLNVEMIAQAVAAKTGKNPAEYEARIHVIPDDEMKAWRSLNDKNRKQELSEMKASGVFPPVQYLESFDLNNARVAIDEFHRYFNKKSPVDVLLMWNDWFAEIRKTGCTFEAITQDLGQLPLEFIGKVGLRTDLVPYNTVRDPFLNIPLGDWYELRAAYLGVREQKVCQTEYRKGTSFTGRAKWVSNSVDRFAITADLFPFYNSYQKTEATGTTASITHPADRYKKLTAFWFLRRHFFKILGKILIVILVAWLTLGGGLVWGINTFVGMLGKVTEANGVKKQNGTVSKKQSPSKSKKSSSLAASVGSAGATAASASGSVDGAGESETVTVVPVPPPVPDLSGFKPAMFLDGGCYLRSGLFISVGYMFKDGHYEGKKVISVNFETRAYELDNGELVHMY